MHYLYFICEPKFYARTHVKIARNCASPTSKVLAPGTRLPFTLYRIEFVNIALRNVAQFLAVYFFLWNLTFTVCRKGHFQSPSTLIRKVLKRRFFFPPFAKKYASTRSAFESFSPIHTKTMEIRLKYDSILHRACVMQVVNDAWHRVFVHPRVSDKPAVFLKISALRGVFEKTRFRWPVSMDTCGRWARPELKYEVGVQRFTGLSQIGSSYQTTTEDELYVLKLGVTPAYVSWILQVYKHHFCPRTLYGLWSTWPKS